MAENVERFSDRTLGGRCYWSWSAAVNLSTGTKVGFCGRSVGRSVYGCRGAVQSSSISAPFRCSIWPASPMDDNAVDNQGNVSRISMHRYRRGCYRWPRLTACRPVHRVCSAAGRPQLSPAVNVRLGTPNSAICRLGSVPNRGKQWTLRDTLRGACTCLVRKEPHGEVRGSQLSL